MGLWLKFIQENGMKAITNESNQTAANTVNIVFFVSERCLKGQTTAKYFSAITTRMWYTVDVDVKACIANTRNDVDRLLVDNSLNNEWKTFVLPPNLSAQIFLWFGQVYLYHRHVTRTQSYFVRKYSARSRDSKAQRKSRKHEQKESFPTFLNSQMTRHLSRQEKPCETTQITVAKAYVWAM